MRDMIGLDVLVESPIAQDRVPRAGPSGEALSAGARCGQPAASGTKNALQARRSAEALFRHCRPHRPSAQPIVRRPPDHPSRSGHREASAGEAFFRASGRGATGDRASTPGPALLNAVTGESSYSQPSSKFSSRSFTNVRNLVPFVEDEHTVFLKTIIPSRKATKQYLGEESDDET